MVLDPSIEPSAAIPLADWLSRQSRLADVLVSVCSSYAYTPSDRCDQDADQYESAHSDQSRYLSAEWARQLELSRDPNVVLGDSPPWKAMP
jgi:hypothetical protein